MKLTVSFDPLHFLGIAVLALIAGVFGSFVGVVAIAAVTPQLDGAQFYALAGGLMQIGSLLPLKIPVALVAAGVAMACASSTRRAVAWSMTSTALLGLLVMLFAL